MHDLVGYLYEKHHSDKRSEEAVEVLWKLVAGLFMFSFVNFGLFLKSIKPEYLWTFFGAQTGKQFAVSAYHQAESEEMKFNVFNHHRSFYLSINDE